VVLVIFGHRIDMLILVGAFALCQSLKHVKGEGSQSPNVNPSSLASGRRKLQWRWKFSNGISAYR
jgi:hypothetical protein